AVPDSWLALPPDDPRWLARWQAAGRVALDAVLGSTTERAGTDASEPLTRATPRISGTELAVLVARASGPRDVLVLGSSNPVRDLDLVAEWDDAPLVISNRGLSGIDGMTATAAGVALALPDRVVRAVVGDLTFLHDVGGLLTGSLEARPHLQIVVANDDGGSVFVTLEHGEPNRAEVFERFFATPHGADLAALCAGYGVRHRLARDAEEIAESLAAPGPGVSVLEVRVDRSRRRELDAAIAARVARTLGG
ncbi:MAG: thiamine pyrophosphate-dependent enzyme, partial [Actinomycetota bacterium]|nr:thiamine pyrophosphate-dependent enzyme [Actinomycetota bacterium]